MEDSVGLPFVGASGDVLRKAVQRCLPGIKVRYTNTVRCRPPGNRKPTIKERNLCEGLWLHPELKRTKPALLVALGDTASRSLLGFGGVLKNEGKTFPSPYGVVMVMAHPAYILCMPEKQPRWEAKLRTIPGILKPAKDLAFTMAVTDAEAQEALEALQGPAIAFDYETEGLHPWKDQVLTVGLCDSQENLVCLDLRKVAKEVWKTWLSSPIKKIVHSSFEQLVSLSVFGVEIRNLGWDTQLWAKLRDENGDTSLKTLALLSTDLGDYARDIRSSVGQAGWKDHDLNKMARYNCADALATYRIYQLQRGISKNDEACSHAVEDAMPWHAGVSGEHRLGPQVGTDRGDEDPDGDSG